MKTSVIIVGANGRMGRVLSSIVSDHCEYELGAMVDSRENISKLPKLDCLVKDNVEDVLKEGIRGTIIDFSAPSVSINSANMAVHYKCPIVIGTTGFTDNQKSELEQCALKTALFWSSNMSIGINSILKIIPILTKALGDDYDIEMVELHHKHKKDSPSGTALMLGECLAKAKDWNLPDVRVSARDGIIGERPRVQIGIQAIRGGDVVGVHTIYFMGQGERIEVTHQAHSRETFAMGALRAAKWLTDQNPGKIYNMLDVV